MKVKICNECGGRHEVNDVPITVCAYCNSRSLQGPMEKIDMKGVSKLIAMTILEMDEHHSVEGTTPVYNVNGHKYMHGVPLPDSMDSSCGQRYKVTFEKLPPNPNHPPRGNPWRQKNGH